MVNVMGGGRLAEMKVVVVGETRTPTPFIGPVDGLVRTWLKSAGINPFTEAAYVVLSDACAGNVEWLQPKWTLALGEQALRLLCPVRSMTLKHAHGHCWQTTSGMAMATYHPWTTKHGVEAGIKAAADIEMLGLCVKGDVVPAYGDRCVRCHKEGVEVVVKGLPLGRKCRRFARTVVVQEQLFEMRVKDTT